MTIKQLRDKLAEFPEDMQVMLLDGNNGGGTLREINHGPVHCVVTSLDKDRSADCDGLAKGTRVVRIGYGCY